jgi:four helix bundle protein
MELGHERLDVYKLALEVARWAAVQPFPSVRKHLRDQLIRAADSVVLNIAEGSGREPGDARRNHLRIAAGSAAEAAAVLDLVTLPDGAASQDKLRRVVAMLSKLSRR